MAVLKRWPAWSVSGRSGAQVPLSKEQAAAAPVARQGASGSTEAHVVGGPGSFHLPQMKRRL